MSRLNFENLLRDEKNSLCPIQKNLKDLFLKPFYNFLKAFLRFFYCRPAIFPA